MKRLKDSCPEADRSNSPLPALPLPPLPSPPSRSALNYWTIVGRAVSMFQFNYLFWVDVHFSPLINKFSLSHRHHLVQVGNCFTIQSPFPHIYLLTVQTPPPLLCPYDCVEVNEHIYTLFCSSNTCVTHQEKKKKISVSNFRHHWFYHLPTRLSNKILWDVTITFTHRMPMLLPSLNKTSIPYNHHSTSTSSLGQSVS